MMFDFPIQGDTRRSEKRERGGGGEGKGKTTEVHLQRKVIINTKQFQVDTIISTSFVFLFHSKEGRWILTSPCHSKVHLNRRNVCFSVLFLVGGVTPWLNEQI